MLRFTAIHPLDAPNAQKQVQKQKEYKGTVTVLRWHVQRYSRSG